MAGLQSTTGKHWAYSSLPVCYSGGFHGHGFMGTPSKPAHLHHLWGKVKDMSPEERRAYIRQRFEGRQQTFNDHFFEEEKTKE